MSQWHRANPESDECNQMHLENERAIFAAKMEAIEQTECTLLDDIAFAGRSDLCDCPNCRKSVPSQTLEQP